MTSYPICHEYFAAEEITEKNPTNRAKQTQTAYEYSVVPARMNFCMMNIYDSDQKKYSACDNKWAAVVNPFVQVNRLTEFQSQESRTLFLFCFFPKVALHPQVLIIVRLYSFVNP